MPDVLHYSTWDLGPIMCATSMGDATSALPAVTCKHCKKLAARWQPMRTPRGHGGPGEWYIRAGDDNENVVCDLLSETTAWHVANLHNKWLKLIEQAGGAR
jgi:hypothetical protein